MKEARKMFRMLFELSKKRELENEKNLKKIEKSS